MAFRVRHNPHNELLTLANYHRKVIADKVERGDSLGITLDCTSCLIALAFYVEALINFVGKERVLSWRERDYSIRKVELVLRTLGLPIDLEGKPFSAISTLREVRNGLAHGKPVQRMANATNRTELGEITRGPWGEHANPATVNDLYRQVVELRDVLFNKAGIRFGASLTSAVGSFE
ncbi:hypothetical protein PQQ51_34105, partial [Paraburkholderia xenovorans]|uniref:hypothetical protein n=1 Tax=Paraburkholderia xenovorans TaxID=36873 RepID=UPI0038BD763F